MFNNNTYQILRLYNSEIYSSYIFRNDYRAKAVLLKLYKAYNQARRNPDIDNPTEIFDWDFVYDIASDFEYNDWHKIHNRINDVSYLIRKLKTGFNSFEVCRWYNFSRFVINFLDYTNERNIEIWDLSYCEDCGGTFPNNEMVSVYGGDSHVCQGCRDEEYYFHESSDQYVAYNDEEYSEFDDDEGDPDSDFEGVYRYDFDVMDRLHKMKLPYEQRITRKTLLAGLECEWEARNDCPHDFPDQIDNLFDNKYCMFKGDGSLRNGFEMVTAPCTLAYHRKQIDKLFDWEHWTDNDKNTYVKAWNTDTCGIHVHLNRGSFTGSQIGKILQIVNEDMNRNFIEAVAGRKANDYAKFKQKSIAEGSQRDYSKYESVNTAHSQSIELRIFRGNVTKNGILRVLEFSFALGEYVQQCSFNELHYRDFLKWFKLPRNRADFPYINEWFVRKGYLKDSRPNRLVTNEINEAIDNVVNG